MGEIKPRAEVLRQAMERSKQEESPATTMLTVPEACERLRISKWTLYRLIQAGKLTSVKIGSRRLISLASIAKFIEQLESEAGV